MAKLQTTIKRAATQTAEIDADLNVTQAELKASLQVKYETMLQAQLDGDTKTLAAARARYKAEFEVAKAKNKAAKLRAQNKANAVDDTVIEAAASLREQVDIIIMKAKAEEGAGEKPMAVKPDGLDKSTNVLWNGDGATGGLVTEGAGEKPKAGQPDELDKANNVLGNEGGATGHRVTEGVGKTTLQDWAEDTGELAKTAPIKIPENATIKSGNKAAGYDQVSYKWTVGVYKYETRWHTKTPGAPAGQSNTWVITRVTPGTSTGNIRTVHILAGDKWVTRYEWQAAINAYQNGAMTIAQEAMLKAGHWLAP